MHMIQANLAEGFVQVVKTYYSLLAAGAFIFGLAWWIKSNRDALFEKLDKWDSNHLPHIQHATEESVRELSAIRESSGKNEAQHDEQIRLLSSIDDSLRHKD